MSNKQDLISITFGVFIKCTLHSYFNFKFEKAKIRENYVKMKLYIYLYVIRKICPESYSSLRAKYIYNHNINIPTYKHEKHAGDLKKI